MKQAVRLTLKLGKVKRKIVATNPPFPSVGDLVTIDGQDWPVVKAQKTQVVFEFERLGKRLKQVYP